MPETSKKYAGRESWICYQILALSTIILLLTIGLGTCFFTEECRQTPGLLSRCDKTTQCIYSERDQSSWDFLCCEDGSGWVAFHTLHPLFIYMYSGSFFFTGFVFFFWEAIEESMLNIFGQYIGFTTTEADNESKSGILLGDACLQGGYGLLIGLLIWFIFRQPPLLPDYFDSPRKMFWKYFLFCLFITLSFGSASITVDVGFGENRLLNLGFLLGVAFQLTLVLFVFKWFTSSKRDRKYHWGNYSTRKRNLFLKTWAVVIFLIAIQNTGYIQYLPNDYYQSWASTWVILLVLGTISLNKFFRKEKKKVLTV